MSRYLERADNVARFIDVNSRLILDMGLDHHTAQWEPLVLASGDEADFKSRYSEYNEKSVVHFLTFDAKNPNSILSCVQKARENARTVREVITTEIWEVVNLLYHDVVLHSKKRKIKDLQGFLNSIHASNHLCTGLIQNTMSHNEPWHFSRMGMLLERADKTARLLDVKYFLLLPSSEYIDSTYDTLEWTAVLMSVSGFEMYNKQFHHSNRRQVAQFLILDGDFPRAIRYCIHAASRSLAKITDYLQIQVPATAQMAKLRLSLDDMDIDSILKMGFHEFIDMMQKQLNDVDSSLNESFFAIEASSSSID
jgi:uncharacterized alpha-E superfamily protein